MLNKSQAGIKHTTVLKSRLRHDFAKTNMYEKIIIKKKKKKLALKHGVGYRSCRTA